MFLSVSAIVTAQINYEIRAVNKGGGNNRVEMRMTAGINDHKFSKVWLTVPGFWRLIT
ncbi:MAG: hypothetical protein ACR2KZ_20430 [Segetibacter sp.]